MLAFRSPLCVVTAAGVMGVACSHAPVHELSVRADAREPAAIELFQRHVRSTGTIQAFRVFNVLVPQIRGPGGRLTLTRLIPNGTQANQGDVLAEFDRTQQVDDARDTKAKVDDLAHQIEQLRAQYRSDAAKRSSDLKQAEADLAKAEIELQKGEVLSEIDRLKNQAKAESARARVASLKKSGHFHDLAETAGVRILELQRDRQQVALERAQTNMEKLTVRAPITGMVALESTWRNGSAGPMQVGDQGWPGQALVRIFDPSDMVVITMVSEPDGAAIAQRGARAKVYLDAYPGAVFDAHLEAASPVASGGIQSPIRSFTARFRLEQRDRRLLPDLSAAVEIVPAGVKP
ncbi:MAG: HlyD family secretion protein [Acidobacteria bacterium]|nr:MAG: HlyD family secretion protein [Acidobacteriota bacterium]